MKRSTILLIEDDAFFSQIIKNTLEARGFDVVWAANGEDGVRQALSIEPDLIVLDVMMPKKNGFQVLDELKEHEVSREIPIMMLTSMSSREDIERCLTVGACDYLIKAHHTPEEVAGRVVRALEKKSNGFSLPELIVVIALVCLLGIGIFIQYQRIRAEERDERRMQAATAALSGLAAAYQDGYAITACASGDQVSACRLCREATCEGEDQTRVYVPEDVAREFSIQQSSCTPSSTEPCISTIEFDKTAPINLETVRIRFFLERSQGSIKGGMTHLAYPDGSME